MRNAKSVSTQARGLMDEAPQRTPKDAMGALRERAEGLEQWLRENAPKVTSEQAHLDSGSEARAYWNYGYVVALRDVLSLVDPGRSPLN